MEVLREVEGKIVPVPKHYIIKAEKREEIKLRTFLTWAVEWGKWPVPRLSRLYPQIDEFQSQSKSGGDGKSICFF